MVQILTIEELLLHLFEFQSKGEIENLILGLTISYPSIDRMIIHLSSDRAQALAINVVLHRRINQLIRKVSLTGIRPIKTTWLKNFEYVQRVKYYLIMDMYRLRRHKNRHSFENRNILISLSLSSNVLQICAWLYLITLLSSKISAVASYVAEYLLGNTSLV